MKGKPLLFSLLLMSMLAALLLETAQVRAALTQALVLCGTALIPALLPFLILSRMLTALLPVRAPRFLDAGMQRCFGLSGNCFFPLLISFLGGYPVGVAAAVSLYENGALTREDCRRLLPVCNNSGPGFFIAFLGGSILESPSAGLLLYAVHVFSALLCARLLAKPRPPFALRRSANRPLPGLLSLFSGAIAESCQAMLLICTQILFFSVFPVFLAKLHLPAQPETFLLGIIELTSGCLHLRGLSGALPLAAFFMGWGGLCVHMQAISLWAKTGIPVRGYLPCKLLHGLMSACFILLLLTPTRLNLLLGAGLVALCVIFPRFQKKYGGNRRRIAV